MGEKGVGIDGGVGLTGKTDIELLDAYSRAVTTVVEAVGPAVVSIPVGRETPEGNGVEPIGAGSGVLRTPDGYVLTTHHPEVAVRELARLDVLRGSERKVLEVEIGEAAA
jgi:hypothetical protein